MDIGVGRPTIPLMQAPIVVFDHTAKTVTTIQVGRSGDKRLADVLASQRVQTTTSGRPAK